MNEETQDRPKRLTPWGKMPHEAYWMWHSKSKKAKVQKSTSWGPELLLHLSLLSARREILDALKFLLKKHYSNRQWMKTAKSVTKRNGHIINCVVNLITPFVVVGRTQESILCRSCIHCLKRWRELSNWWVTIRSTQSGKLFSPVCGSNFWPGIKYCLAPIGLGLPRSLSRCLVDLHSNT